MKFTLSDIITTEFQSEIEESFSLATGFGVVFVDKNGNHIGEGGNFCEFCKAINKTPEGRLACAISNRHAIKLSLKTKTPSIYICHAGLVNIEIPLFYNDEYVGAITAGQVLCDKTDAYPRDDIKIGNESTIDPKLYEKIQIMSTNKIEATAKSLHSISNYIMQTAEYNRAQQELLIWQKKKMELENQLNLAELDALQKQVAPHFIFNVINVISRLISMKDYDNAKEMLDSFTKMMRYTLHDIKTDVTLGQEISYIENYILIQKKRFGDRIEFEILCDENIKNFKIPFFSIQPLVENSIEHGLLKLASGGKTSLICRSYRDYTEIRIRDNGIGISKNTIKKIEYAMKNKDKNIMEGSIGLINSYLRFNHMYNEGLVFKINSEASEGCEIIIRIMNGK